VSALAEQPPPIEGVAEFRALGIRSVDAFCNGVIRDFYGRKGGYLTAQDRADLLSRLRGKLVACRHDFEPARCSSFSKFARGALWLEIINWLRAEKGDTRYRPRPLLEPLHDHVELFDEMSNRDLDELLEIDTSQLTPISRSLLRWVAPLLLEQGVHVDDVADLYGPARGWTAEETKQQLRDLRRELRAIGKRPFVKRKKKNAA
jgi:hypothetical protein